MTEIANNFAQVPFGTDNFAENPEPRCPLVLLLDTSGSMAGDPISQLNEGLVTLKDELSADSLVAKRVEIAIIKFGPVETLNDFHTVGNFYPPHLKASGDTPMGAAINQGLDLLKIRKELYRANGIDYYRPWVMLITDGGPTDQWRGAANRVHEGESAKAFSFFAIGVEKANMDTLKEISVRQPLKLKGLRYRDLFAWLSKSMKSVSQSAVGDTVPITNPATPEGWASV